jgi:large subunit ribosomal protein L21
MEFSVPLIPRAFFMAYAIIETGGKQYRVQKDSVIDVEKLAHPSKGKAVKFERVLLVSEGGKVKVGEPAIDGAHVTAEVLADKLGKKVTHFVYNRRKGYHKTRGHRQPITRVKITAIHAAK